MKLLDQSTPSLALITAAALGGAKSMHAALMRISCGARGRSRSLWRGLLVCIAIPCAAAAELPRVKEFLVADAPTQFSLTKSENMLVPTQGSSTTVTVFTGDRILFEVSRAQVPSAKVTAYCEKGGFLGFGKKGSAPETPVKYLEAFRFIFQTHEGVKREFDVKVKGPDLSFIAPDDGVVSIASINVSDAAAKIEAAKQCPEDWDKAKEPVVTDDTQSKPFVLPVRVCRSSFAAPPASHPCFT